MAISAFSVIRKKQKKQKKKTNLRWLYSLWKRVFHLEYLKKLMFGYLLGSPHRGESNKYPKNLFLQIPKFYVF